MIVLGIVLVLLGWLLPDLGILATIGWVLIVVGIVLLLVRPGGRRYY